MIAVSMPVVVIVVAVVATVVIVGVAELATWIGRVVDRRRLRRHHELVEQWSRRD